MILSALKRLAGTGLVQPATGPGRLVRLLALGLLLLACGAPAAAQEGPPAPRTLTYTDAVILGLVEGVTEFLPVSSTGHLVLANHFLGLNEEAPIAAAGNRPAGEAGAPAPAPMTVKAAADAYAIVIQIGAIAAVLIICWGRVRSIMMGVLGKDRQGFLLARNLMAAFLPAVAIGLFLEEWIDRYLFNTWPVIAALFAGGLLILGVERLRRRPAGDDPGPDLHELTLVDSLMIGLLQCVAMWPGTSRSMMTIVGGYLAGLSPRRAAEFSFLLGLITLSAASLYKGLKAGSALLDIFAPGPLLVGVAVAALSAALAVKWMIDYLGRHGLGIFAWYRMGLALVILMML